MMEMHFLSSDREPIKFDCLNRFLPNIRLRLFISLYNTEIVIKCDMNVSDKFLHIDKTLTTVRKIPEQY